jgi:hypothetical protein
MALLILLLGVASIKNTPRRSEAGNVVRTRQTGRERLGTDVEMAGIIQAKLSMTRPRPELSVSLK